MRLANRSSTRILLSWSSGKDSAWALRLLRESERYDVVALVTTIDANSGCVPVHGTQPDVLAAQAECVGLPLVTAPLDWPCPNAEYESAFAAALARCEREFGAKQIAFGDLFLEDIRAYRLRLSERIGWEALFPLWKKPTPQLAHEMIAGGLTAVVSAVNTDVISASYCGRLFDLSLISDLQSVSDPCGENGEFHTIVCDSPDFRHPLQLVKAKIISSGSLAVQSLRLAGDAG